jgi:[acyl-carrier-protein] S-malonyltransferase
MFPGQVSQALGMGMDLYGTDPAMRATYDEASQALGHDLARLCAEGPAELLARTDLTQPALLAHSIGVFRILVREGLLDGEGGEFGCALGHSLGEYTALVATGALAFDDGVRLVWRRGDAMLAAARARPGAMAALIGLDEEIVEELCAAVPDVWPANFNAPGQVVVSGTKAGLAVLSERALEAGARRVIPLQVSGAFHSPLIGGASGPLSKALAASVWHEPRPPFFSVCSLDFESGGFPELMTRQLVSPVRFTQAVKELSRTGYDSFLEVGSGSVLSGLVARIAPDVAVARVGDATSLETWRASRQEKRREAPELEES